jgi:spore germination protein YaaH
LYMRIWEEDLTTHKVTGKTLSMSNAEKVTTAKSILPSWKGVYWEKKALLECSYEENDKRYTYWLEDANSIRRKAALVKQYDLAGVASWRKGFENAGCLAGVSCRCEIRKVRKCGLLES